MQAKLLTLLMATMVVCHGTSAQYLPDYVPQNDLLGWFPMDGNADDLSPLQHHGLTSGPIAWGSDRFGNANAALDLSAEGGDYVDLPSVVDSFFSNAMTVACWVNYPAEPGQTIFRSGPTPGLYDNFQALIWDHVGLQQMTLRLYTEAGYYTSYPYPEEEQWKHLTMMVQEDLVKLFVNGQLVHEHSGNSFSNSPGIFRIGESMFSNPYDYRGSIDDFGVWNRALSTTEVELLYSETPIAQGCTDDTACNYSPGANLNDGSCTYPLIAGDCNAGAVACSEGMYWNPLVQQCMPTTCPTCPADVDQDNTIGVSDLLQMLSLFGGVCPEGGCTDLQAMNYDPLVGFNDGSCIYPPCLDALDPFGPCDDGNSNTFNDLLDADGCLCEGDDYVAEDGSGPCEGVSTLNFFGHDYQLVEIGDQCWFAENSRNAQYTNGDSLLTGLGDEAWSNQLEGAATAYGEGEGMCGGAFATGYNACDADFTAENFGWLYNFFAVADDRGLCPTGWSVASDDDWKALESHLGVPQSELDSTGYRGTNQGTLLKSTALWYAGGNGTDSLGFSAPPGGYKHYEYGGDVDLGYNANFWTTTPWAANTATKRTLYFNQDGIARGPHNIRQGHSIRCIKSPIDSCYDPDGDGVCPEDEISGCTSAGACNYNASATHDDGSCYVNQVGAACDDGDSNTFNDAWDETGCNCSGAPAVASDGSGPCEGQASVNYHGTDYDLVEIGDQCWFRENLQSLQFTNGDTIPNYFSLAWGYGQWISLTNTGPAATTFAGNTANLLTFGALYNGTAVDDSRGLCPSGWHVPSEEDWMDMQYHLGMNPDDFYSTDYEGAEVLIGDQLRDASFSNGSNTSGFSALAGGYVNPGGGLDSFGTRAIFWSSSTQGGGGWTRWISNDAPNAIRRKFLDARNGLSVRCVLDPEEETNEAGTPCDDGDANTYNDVWDVTGTDCMGTSAVALDGTGPCEGQASVNYHGTDYDLVEIGDQCWFRENLQSLQFTNGDTIPNYFSLAWGYGQWISLTNTGPAATTFAGNTANLLTFGALYNGTAVDDSRGLCPSGWHVPSEEDWMDMQYHLGMNPDDFYSTDYEGAEVLIGDQLRDASFSNGSNTSGFSALAGGYVNPGGGLDSFGTRAIFWSSSTQGGGGWTRWISNDAPNAIRRKFLDARNGLSVRCVLDPEEETNEAGTPCDDGDANTYNDVWDVTGTDCMGTSAVALDGTGPCEGQASVNYHGTDYDLVEIGDQCWFRENLQSLQFTNGDTIPNYFSLAWGYGQWISLTNAGPAATTFAGNTANLLTFGALYNGTAVDDSRGLCPSGWHVPSEEDWMDMQYHLGMNPDDFYSTDYEGAEVLIGDQLRDASFSNGSNTSGFSALAGGYVNPGGGLYSFGTRAIFWSSSTQGSGGWTRWISNDAPNAIRRKFLDARNGLSVRCVLDPEEETNEAGTPCDDGDANTYNDVWSADWSTCSGDTAVVPDGSGPCEGQASVNYYSIDYNLVEIGDQCWFRENLKTRLYQNGDSIQLILGDDEWSATEEAAVTYRPDSLQTLTHGYYYNWWAVTSETGICPTGWRSPSHGDWSDLEFALGMDSIQAYSLGYSRGMQENIASIMLTAGSNTSGFSATGNGYRSESGAWGNTYTVFWTSDDASNNSGAITRKLLGIDNGATAVLDPKKWGAAVRCLKEETE